MQGTRLGPPSGELGLSQGTVLLWIRASKGTSERKQYHLAWVKDRQQGPGLSLQNLGYTIPVSALLGHSSPSLSHNWLAYGFG
jgi:hypothetical protein